MLAAVKRTLASVQPGFVAFLDGTIARRHSWNNASRKSKDRQ